MTKAVSKREICLIKAVLLLCEHGYFSLNFASNGVNCSPILLWLNNWFTIDMKVVLIERTHFLLLRKSGWKKENVLH